MPEFYWNTAQKFAPLFFGITSFEAHKQPTQNTSGVTVGLSDTKVCVMAPSVGLWLCLYLLLLFTDAKTVGQHDGQRSAIDKPSSLKLEPLLTTKQLKAQDDSRAPDQSLPLPEMLDLDEEQHRRLARGTDEEEQQSTFSQSFENDSVTTPQATEFTNVTTVAAATVGDGDGDAGDKITT